MLTAHDTDIYVIMSIQCFINVGHSLVANQCPKSICLKSIKFPLQLRLCHLHCPSTLGLRKRKYRMITGFAQVHVQNRVAVDSMKMHTHTYIYYNFIGKGGKHFQISMPSPFLFLCPRRNFGWHIKIAPSVRPSVRQSVRPLLIVSQ